MIGLGRGIFLLLLLLAFSGCGLAQFFNFPGAGLVRKVAQVKSAVKQEQAAKSEETSSLVAEQPSSGLDRASLVRQFAPVPVAQASPPPRPLEVLRAQGRPRLPVNLKPQVEETQGDGGLDAEELSQATAGLPAQEPPQDFAAFAPRGNAQVYSPDRSPLQQRLQVQDIKEPADFDLTSRLPPSQDFLPTCPDASFSYIIPSPSQCDLYYLCEFGTPSKKVCEDGLVFSLEDVKCVAAHKTTCEDRPLLQTPKGTGPCERRNGIFYTNTTCTEFVTCRNNVPSFERCAPGLVFDPVLKICAWADEALRPGCMPEDLLGFRCPNPKLTKEQALISRVHLRFGDHDRFSDPKDCRFFFMCLRTGQPRRAGCSNGKVFDRSSGICKLAKDVPECSNYYNNGSTAPNQQSAASPAAPTSVDEDRLRKIEESIKQQFDERRQQLQLRIKRWIKDQE